MGRLDVRLLDLGKGRAGDLEGVTPLCLEAHGPLGQLGETAYLFRWVRGLPSTPLHTTAADRRTDARAVGDGACGFLGDLVVTHFIFAIGLRRVGARAAAAVGTMVDWRRRRPRRSCCCRRC